MEFNEKKPTHQIKEIDDFFKLYLSKEVRELVGIERASKVEIVPDEEGRGIFLRLIQN